MDLKRRQFSFGLEEQVGVVEGGVIKLVQRDIRQAAESQCTVSGLHLRLQYFFRLFLILPKSDKHKECSPYNFIKHSSLWKLYYVLSTVVCAWDLKMTMTQLSSSRNSACNGSPQY